MRRESATHVLRCNGAAAIVGMVFSLTCIASCSATSFIKLEGGCENKTVSENWLCCGKTLFIINGARSSRQRPEDYYHCCMNAERKGEIYQPEEAVCCNGSLYSKETTSHLQCCGGRKTFNSLTHVCCVGEGPPGTDFGIYAKSPRHLCCGKLFYNNVTHMCCSSSDGRHNVVHELPHEEAQELIPQRRTACCGNATYQTGTSHVCRHDHITTMSELCEHMHEPEQYSNHTHLCCSGKVASKAEHVCCQGKLHVLRPGFVCCGTNYNDGNHLCCSGVANRIDSDQSDLNCCGTTTYNVRTQICVDDKIFDNNFGSHGTACVSRNSDKVWIMDIRKHMCCNGQAYLSNTYLCCNGTAVMKQGSGDWCCGSKAYDPVNQECTPSGEVQNYSTEHRNPTQSTCNGRNINPITTICCKGRRLAKLMGNMCCGHKNYFKQQLTCCNERLFQRKTERPCKNAL